MQDVEVGAGAFQVDSATENMYDIMKFCGSITASTAQLGTNSSRRHTTVILGDLTIRDSYTLGYSNEMGPPGAMEVHGKLHVAGSFTMKLGTTLNAHSSVEIGGALKFGDEYLQPAQT
jgi:hypothetical protein